jgi:hypothetical protein
MKAKAVFKDEKWYAVCHFDQSAILGEKRLVRTEHILINPANLVLKKGQPYYDKDGNRCIWASDDFDKSTATRFKDGLEIEGEKERIPADFGKGRECVITEGNSKGKRGKITMIRENVIYLDTFPDHAFHPTELKCLDTMQVFTVIVGDEELADRVLLPKSYRKLEEQPYFKGKGEHSVMELEKICEQFSEYCHQQAIIKQNLKKMLQE